ncbi:MAG: hisitdine kinase [Acidobacteria bacterium]|nr:hisitdine kinase [Acidobacteriota bacterium]
MKRTLIALLLASAALPAHAQSKFNLGLGVGTLGGSVSASYRASSGIGLRAVYNDGRYTRNFTQRDINFDATVKLESFGGILDIYPTGRAFRISAGALSNRNRADGITTENNVVIINGVRYPAALVGFLTAQAKVNKTTPYAGFGWASNASKVGLTFDVGAVYHGAPKLSVQAHPTIPALVPASFYTDLEAERAQTEQEISKYKWHPVVQLGITFNF